MNKWLKGGCYTFAVAAIDYLHNEGVDQQSHLVGLESKHGIEHVLVKTDGGFYDALGHYTENGLLELWNERGYSPPYKIVVLSPDDPRLDQFEFDSEEYEEAFELVASDF
jgi:hypothetical protein